MKYNPNNPQEKAKALIDFNKIIEGDKLFELKTIKKKRSIKQNAYLHVVITLYSIEFGWTLEEGKVHLKRICPFMMYEKNNEKFLRETKKMDSKQLTEFIEWIRNHASKNGCYIPSSEEYLSHKFEIDKQIDSCKAYL